MATYFRKYYFEFRDNPANVSAPKQWRVDILDSVGQVPTEPYLLQMGLNPITVEIAEPEEETGPIGAQAVIEYVYDGNPNIPLPTEFFEAEEKRYIVELRANNVLQRTFYIRPDSCEYPDKLPPFTVRLFAVDGFSYCKQPRSLNVYDSGGLLQYEKRTLYDIMMTRGLLQMFPNEPTIKVLQTLVPVDIPDTEHTLFGVQAHIDMFYDFVEGPNSIHDMLRKFCRAFYANIFTSAGTLWFRRNQDLDLATFTVDHYTDDETVVAELQPDFIKTIGASINNDGVTLMPPANIRMEPAVKEAPFDLNYKGINQLLNFDWADFDGVEFDNWTNQTPVIVGRVGDGTITSPYKALINYNAGGLAWIRQQLPDTITSPGDIIEVEFRYRFNNTKSFAYRVGVFDLIGGPPQVLDGAGNWAYGGGEVNLSMRIPIARSGRKREGSIKIKSKPIPKSTKEGVLSDQIYLSFEIFVPTEFSDFSDGPFSPAVEIWPVKLSVIRFSSLGRHYEAVNQADFSRNLENSDFWFIDTGEDGISNTLFAGASSIPVTGGWDNDKVNPGDIERHMSGAYIDQNSRSVTTWDGLVKSNDIDYHNVIEIAEKPGRRWRQVSDTYDIINCLHKLKLREIFNEGNASVDYQEWDIEENS